MQSVSRIIREAAEGDSAVLAPAVSLMAEIGELGGAFLENFAERSTNFSKRTRAIGRNPRTTPCLQSPPKSTECSRT
jgi:hypothetical protein